MGLKRPVGLGGLEGPKGFEKALKTFREEGPFPASALRAWPSVGVRPKGAMVPSESMGRFEEVGGWQSWLEEHRQGPA